MVFSVDDDAPQIGSKRQWQFLPSTRVTLYVCIIRGTLVMGRDRDSEGMDQPLVIYYHYLEESKHVHRRTGCTLGLLIQNLIFTIHPSTSNFHFSTHKYIQIEIQQEIKEMGSGNGVLRSLQLRFGGSGIVKSTIVQYFQIQKVPSCFHNWLIFYLAPKLNLTFLSTPLEYFSKRNKIIQQLNSSWIWKLSR